MKTIHFRKTREYLGRVKEAARMMENVKDIYDLCEDAGMEVGELQSALELTTRHLALEKFFLANKISGISKAEYQWVLIRRYVDLLSWDDIAREGNTSRRYVLSIHGLALPEMQDVLVDAGVIAPEDADDIEFLLTKEGTLDIGTMEDYLKYREEKKQKKREQKEQEERERREV